jgi:hypothetical protein
MTDRGLTALTAAIHSLHHHVTIANGQPSPDFDGEFAAAILGGRGVFTADGTVFAAGIEKIVSAEHGARAEIATLRAALADEKERNGLYLATLDNMNATIARLRAALDGLRADDLWLGVELYAVGDVKFSEPMVSASGARAAIRAALAKAKEATQDNRTYYCGHAIDPVEGVCLVCGEA